LNAKTHERWSLRLTKPSLSFNIDDVAKHKYKRQRGGFKHPQFFIPFYELFGGFFKFDRYKQTCMKSIYALLCAITFLTGTVDSASGQTPTDKVVMLNGEEKNGQVTEMGDTYVRFVYAGETLVYTLRKDEINKIQFASGRIEFITKPTTDGTQTLQEHHNLVAVLPIAFIEQGGARDEKMALKAQSDFYTILKRSMAQLQPQDPLTTNALLAKNGLDAAKLQALVPAEIAHILGVEYVIFATVTINQRGVTTSGGGSYTSKTKDKKTTSFFSSATTTTENFTTSVDMKIYTDQGQNIFSQSHESVWSTEEAYMVTLQYLLKRSPLYKK
jgi:hypothetical protein